MGTRGIGRRSPALVMSRSEASRASAIAVWVRPLALRIRRMRGPTKIFWSATAALHALLIYTGLQNRGALWILQDLHAYKTGWSKPPQLDPIRRSKRLFSLAYPRFER